MPLRSPRDENSGVTSSASSGSSSIRRHPAWAASGSRRRKTHAIQCASSIDTTTYQKVGSLTWSSSRRPWKRSFAALSRRSAPVATTAVPTSPPSATFARGRPPPPSRRGRPRAHAGRCRRSRHGLPAERIITDPSGRIGSHVRHWGTYLGDLENGWCKNRLPTTQIPEFQLRAGLRALSTWVASAPVRGARHFVVHPCEPRGAVSPRPAATQPWCDRGQSRRRVQHRLRRPRASLAPTRFGRAKVIGTF